MRVLRLWALLGLLLALGCSESPSGPDPVFVDEQFVGEWAGFLFIHDGGLFPVAISITQSTDDGARGAITVDFSSEDGDIISADIAAFETHEGQDFLSFAPEGTSEWWTCFRAGDELEGVVEDTDEGIVGQWNATLVIEGGDGTP